MSDIDLNEKFRGILIQLAASTFDPDGSDYSTFVDLLNRIIGRPRDDLQELFDHYFDSIWIIERESEFYYYDEDGGDSNVSTDVLGADTDRQRLIDRWNSTCESYQVLDEEGKASYNGRNGGGYAGVSYELEVKECNQFDLEKVT